MKVKMKQFLNKNTMKPKILLSLILFLNITMFGYSEETANSESSKLASVTVLATAQTQPLVTLWEDQLNKTNFNVKMEVVDFKVENSTNSKLKEDQLAIMNDSDLSQIQGDTNWEMVIGREIIVPIISVAHPYLQDIMQGGISTQKMKLMMANFAEPTWGYLLGNETKNKVKILVLDETSTKNGTFNFLGVQTASINLNTVSGMDDFLQKVRNDKMAIGFCRLADLAQTNEKMLPAGILLMPFDLNNNGKLEKVENIYTNMETLTRGVWIGKYPKALFQNIYVVSASNVYNEQQKVLIKWIVSQGQTTVEEIGITSLTKNEIAGKYSKIDFVVAPSKLPEKSSPITPYIVTLVVLALMFIAYFEVVLHRSKIRKSHLEKLSHPILKSFNINTVEIPKGIFFDKSHTWAFMEKEGVVRIGLDDFIQKLTGKLTRIILKDEGEKVIKGEPIFTLIQEGKKITINAPVSGTIKSYNQQLINNVSFLNSSPYNEGWVYLIEPQNWNREMEFLRIAEKYSEWIKSEYNRFKDFVAQSIAENQVNPAYTVLQDGGDVIEKALCCMGPEVWEDFQTNFIDNSK